MARRVVVGRMHDLRAGRVVAAVSSIVLSGAVSSHIGHSAFAQGLQD